MLLKNSNETKIETLKKNPTIWDMLQFPLI